MTTMLEVVNDAFEEISVKVAEQALQSDELQSGIRRCNDLLTSWDDIGYIVGYNPVFNGDDDLGIDASTVRAVKANLAVKLAPSFQKPVTLDLRLEANESLDLLINANIFIGKVEFPDTLPLGSGNQGCDFDTDMRFFNNNKDENF